MQRRKPGFPTGSLIYRGNGDLVPKIYDTGSDIAGSIDNGDVSTIYAGRQSPFGRLAETWTDVCSYCYANSCMLIGHLAFMHSLL